MAKTEVAKENKVVKEKKLRWEDLAWVVFLTVYFATLAVLIIWALIAFFPCDLTPNTTCSNNVGFMYWTFQVTDEVRLIILVLIAGALGSLVHGFRSLFWYVGNREFVSSWALMYLLLPFIGSSISVVFYFVLRGGLFSPNANATATSPFGFVGISGLIGLFSNRAALKLQEIAESIFTTKESTKGKDNVDEKKIKEEDHTKK
jgi:magnesium-transporting ATPase (P-type)